MTAAAEDGRLAVVAAARRWIGTPYRHQAMVRGAGCDCWNLVRAVGIETGLMPFDPVAYRQWAGYGRTPHPGRMAAGLDIYLRRIGEDEALPGDIMWIAWRDGLPMHLAIAAAMDGRQMMIHAYADAGGVVEHGFTPEWRQRVVQWWRYPGLVPPSGG